MTNISLLPPEIKIKEKNAKIKFIVIIVVTIFVLLFLTVFTSTRLAIINNNKELIKRQEKIAEIKKEIDKMSVYTELQKRLDNIDKLYEAAMDNNPNWNLIFKNINKKVPPDLVFLEILADNKSENSAGELIIRGYTSKPLSLTNFIDELEKMNEIKKVKISYFKRDEYGTKVMFSYNLICSINPFEYKLQLMEGGR